MLETYTGSCHCGGLKFEADIDLDAGTSKCNCSICSKTRSWEIFVKPDAFRLLQGEALLGDYQFGTNNIHHHFCSHCGVRLFGRGHLEILGGDFVYLNVTVLDGISDARLAALPVHFANGRDNDWMNTPAVTSHL